MDEILYFSVMFGFMLLAHKVLSNNCIKLVQMYVAVYDGISYVCKVCKFIR
jgi:hypothetical protein